MIRIAGLFIVVIISIISCTGCTNVLSQIDSGKSKDDKIMTQSEKNVEICRNSLVYGKWNRIDTEPGFGKYEFGDEWVEFPSGMLYSYSVELLGETEIAIIKNENKEEWFRYEVTQDGANLNISSYDLITGAEESFVFEPDIDTVNN